jgi:hypothetical protein
MNEAISLQHTSSSRCTEFNRWIACDSPIIFLFVSEAVQAGDRCASNIRALCSLRLRNSALSIGNPQKRSQCMCCRAEAQMPCQC